jgi:hypothetical protein
VDTWVWIVIAVVVVLLVAGALVTVQRRRSAQLQQRFGPEYERVVEDSGSRRDAERELADRTKRREQLDIKPLTPAARERYSSAWQAVQTRFVDAPGPAVAEADRLVSEVMQERGYPMDDFEQRAADISVDHPQLVDNYRSAHDLAVRSDAGDATTEELRRAMVHYRSLFEELLEVDTTTTAR